MILRALVMALLTAACTQPVASTVPTVQPGASVVQVLPTPPDLAGTFDIDAVKAFWTAECANPTIVDPDVCADVDIDGMFGQGRLLFLPSRLQPQDRNRAQNACIPFAFAHWDRDGDDYGYAVITILDSFGAPLWSCEVVPS